MKTNFFSFLVVFLFISNISFIQAQIRVESTGKVKVGTASTTVNANDPENIMTMQIFGKVNDGYTSGGKLSFGDIGIQANTGMNVMIGEYGLTDTDQLWLHGKKGIYLTYSYGYSNNVIGYYDIAVGNRFNFNCDVYSSGVKLASDSRFKENVQTLDGALSSLQKINGISYNLNDLGLIRESSGSNSQNSFYKNASAANSLTDKEARDKAFFDKWEEEKNTNKEKRLGFLAQDLQKVFPELVNEAEDGYLYVDYIGLIPVIVEGMKEQTRIIEAQNEKIIELETMIGAGNNLFLKSAAQTTSIDLPVNNNKTTPCLYQNTPNPFSSQTEIKYFIPDNVHNAYICIFNMQGSLLKKIPVDKEGSVFINGAELQAGMYLYSLITDGKEVDTKRMILTK